MDGSIRRHGKGRHLLLWSLAAVMLAETAVQDGIALAACNAPGVRIADPTRAPEPVFVFKRDRCNDLDFPDLPAMAFRDADGMVQLLDTNGNGNYRSIGPSFDTLRRDCARPILTSNADASAPPEAFYNHVWISAPWTADGRTVTALVHNEFQGWRTAVNPPASRTSHCSRVGDNFIEIACAFWNVIAARSTDGGKTYQIVKDAAGRAMPVIATPYAYVKDGGNQQAGNLQSIPEHSNIVARADSTVPEFYVLADSKMGHGVPGGTCLFRSTDPNDPTSWRGWDGTGFTVSQSVSVYRDAGLNPAAHVCRPVLAFALETWTYNTVLGQYMGVARATRFKRPDGSVIEAFLYSLSPDMIHWSQPAFLKEIVWFDEWSKSQPRSGVVGQVYPSLIDPDSPSRIFDRSGQNLYLYYARFNPKQIPFAFDRDLVREKLSLSCGS